MRLGVISNSRKSQLPDKFLTTWACLFAALVWQTLVAKFDKTEGTIFTDKVLLSIYVLFTGVNFYDTLHRVKDQWLGEKASPFVWGEPEL